MAESDAKTDEEINILLTVTAKEGSPRIPLKISKSISVSDLLSAIASATQIPSPKVIFRGRLVKQGAGTSSDAVTEFKLEDGCVLHCMGKPSEGGATTNSSVAIPSTSSSLPSVSVGTTAAPPTAPSVAPAAAPATTPLSAALAQLRIRNPPATYQTAITTLLKLLKNITENPMEEKYRRIKKANPAFNKRLGGVTGARDVIVACGFVETDTLYELSPTPEAWPALLETVRTVETIAAATAAATPPVLGGTATPGMSMPPMGMMPPNMMPPNMPPEMQQAVQAMMSDPAQLQQMLQVGGVSFVMRFVLSLLV